MVASPTQVISTGAGTFNVRRLVLAGALALLLLGSGPIYEYSGSPADQAKLSARYGPPDGGPLAVGPDLFLLPEGWVLAATCLLLGLSAMPFARSVCDGFEARDCASPPGW